MRTGHALPLVLVQTGAPGALSTNRVLRNTYVLLSATLFFSGGAFGAAGMMASIAVWLG